MTTSRLTTGTEKRTLVLIPAQELRDGDRVLTAGGKFCDVERVWRSREGRLFAGSRARVETVQARLTGRATPMGWTLDEQLTVSRLVDTEPTSTEAPSAPQTARAVTTDVRKAIARAGLTDPVFRVSTQQARTALLGEVTTHWSTIIETTSRKRADEIAAALTGLYPRVLTRVGVNFFAVEIAQPITPTPADRPAPATEPVLVVPADPAPAGYAIPAPQDPAERAAWEQGVARRRAEGLGLVVGEDPFPLAPDTEADGHEIGIIPARTRTGGHLATCTCDWHGPTRATHEQAAGDAADHDRATKDENRAESVPAAGTTVTYTGRRTQHHGRPMLVESVVPGPRGRLSATISAPGVRLHDVALRHLHPVAVAQPAPPALAVNPAAETIRADQVTDQDVLLQGKRLSIRRPVTAVEPQGDRVLIRYGSGYTVRPADARITVERRAGAARRTPSIVVVRRPDAELPAMPPLFGQIDAVRSLVEAHPELRSSHSMRLESGVLAVHVSAGEKRTDAATLLAWFYRLTSPSVSFEDYERYGFIAVEVRGTVGGQPVRAWMPFHMADRTAVASRIPSVHLLRDIAVNGLVTA
ncbi:hypothetical protein SUDANB95_05482 [Actinosynnema sp. ALI-1.44]